MINCTSVNEFALGNKIYPNIRFDHCHKVYKSNNNMCTKIKIIIIIIIEHGSRGTLYDEATVSLMVRARSSVLVVNESRAVHCCK